MLLYEIFFREAGFVVQQSSWISDSH